jgi:hypothetical protein
MSERWVWREDVIRKDWKITLDRNGIVREYRDGMLINEMRVCECCGDLYFTEWDGVYCCDPCENGEKECNAAEVSAHPDAYWLEKAKHRG